MKVTKAEVCLLKFRANRSEKFIEMYGVRLHVLPGHDEMWEPMTHSAAFRTKEEAQRLADRVNAIRGSCPFYAPIDFKHWIHEAHSCSPFGAENSVFFYSPVKF